MTALEFLGHLRAKFFRYVVLVFYILTAIFMTLSGPFGTYEEMSLGQRVLYWPALTALSFLIAIPIKEAITVYLRKWPALVTNVMVPVLFSLVFAPIVVSLTNWRVEPENPEQPIGFYRAFVYVLIVSMSIKVICLILRLDEPEEGKPMPRLLSRIPDHNGADVLRLTVDDHYVHVFLTDGAEHRILMRLSDAVAEMDGRHGFYTHRSHWVAFRAIKRLARDDSRIIAVLVDGTQIPVSRTHRENLASAGLSMP